MLTPEKIKILNPESNIAVFLDLENFFHLCADDELEPSLELVLSNFPAYGIAVSCGSIHSLRKIQDHADIWNTLRRLKIQHDDLSSFHQKNGADMQLAVLISATVYVHPHITTYVLITGDRDFIPVAKFLESQGKCAIGVGPEHKVASDFRVALHDYHTIPDLLEKGRLKLEEGGFSEKEDISYLLHAIRESKKEGKSQGYAICSKFRTLFPEHSASQPKFGFKRFCEDQAKLTGKISINCPNKDQHAQYEVVEVSPTQQTKISEQKPKQEPKLMPPGKPASLTELIAENFQKLDFEKLPENALVETIQKLGTKTLSGIAVFNQLQANHPDFDLRSWNLYKKHCREQAAEGKISIKQFTENYWELYLTPAVEVAAAS